MDLQKLVVDLRNQIVGLVVVVGEIQTVVVVVKVVVELVDWVDLGTQIVGLVVVVGEIQTVVVVVKVVVEQVDWVDLGTQIVVKVVELVDWGNQIVVVMVVVELVDWGNQIVRREILEIVVLVAKGIQTVIEGFVVHQIQTENFVVVE